MTEENLDDSAAPLVEHLIELRQRLIRALIAVSVVFVIAFIFADQIFQILVIPYERAAGEDQNLTLIFTAPQEYFFAQLKIALFTALFVAFPVIASQIYKFMAPGLYKNERQAFAPFLIATPILSMQVDSGEGRATIELLPKVSEYLGLIMTLIFAFGLVFQMPVVITLLARAGLFSEKGLKEKRKYAIVLTLVAAAVLTPPDPISQLGLAVPSLLLYELSIFATRLIEQKRQEQEAAEQSA